MPHENVEALEADLLIVWRDLGLCTDTWVRCFTPGAYAGSVSLRMIAERLAARGVLAPQYKEARAALEAERRAEKMANGE